MGSSRPSTYRTGGGGFLHNTDLRIVDATFDGNQLNGQPFVPGKSERDPKKDKFQWLYCRLTVRVDGADADVTTSLKVGGFNDYTISEDGRTVNGPNLSVNEFSKFVGSLCKAGFPDTNFPEEGITLQPAIGARIRTIKVDNLELTKKLGQREGKDGRQYNQQDFLVDQYYGMVEGAKAPAAKGAAAAPAAASVDDLTTTTLLTILAKAPGSKIAKAKLNTAVVQTLVGNPSLPAVRKRILEDGFLAAVDGVSFDGTTVSLA